jgi:hypothetical protein
LPGEWRVVESRHGVVMVHGSYATPAIAQYRAERINAPGDLHWFVDEEFGGSWASSSGGWFRVMDGFAYARFSESDRDEGEITE